MDRAVMISIKPKWCELIVSGKKTIEVRKTAPKIDTPFKCYIYCTLSGSNKIAKDLKKWYREKWYDKKGKVIGEFVCDMIDKYRCSYWDGIDIDSQSLDDTCLHIEEINNYAKGNDLYGWYISDLKIYDTPKEFREFFRPCDGCDKLGTSRCTEEISPCRAKTLTRPFQSWGYVEEM